MTTIFRIQNMLDAWDDRFASTTEERDTIVKEMRNEGVPEKEISVVKEVGE